MPPVLIGPRPTGLPAATTTSRGGARALPADLLREAALRVRIISLLTGVLWIVAAVLGKVSLHAVTPPGDPRWRQLDMTDLIGFISVTISFGLYLFSRRTRRGPQFVLDLGLAYMVVISLALGLMFHWMGAPPDWQVRTEISWAGVMILMFAAIVPTSATRMFCAGILAASMMPLGMLAAHWHGTWHLPSPWSVLLMHYPDYLLVGVAVVISRVVTQLGRQVRKAREMGSYQVGDLLGRGGMGEVYKATHRMLARPAAIKLIRPESLGRADSEAARLAIRRFHREAEAAANLRSPHTVEIYDFGITEDETLYFVMELLQGMDLETLVREHGPLPASRAIHILVQVCESLEEAHRAGLVHRDIKPANIHVGQLALRADFVKVLDFGLVKPVATRLDESSLATVAGQTPGTPAYMAPEMALSEEVDGRTDLYALGCVAYYMLTGQLVFDADSPYQMIARHLQHPPRAPSLRTENHIPRTLEELVLDCLAKERDQRPSSAAEVARRLAAVDVMAWGDEEASRWWDTHHGAIA